METVLEIILHHTWTQRLNMISQKNLSVISQNEIYLNIFSTIREMLPEEEYMPKIQHWSLLAEDSD